MNFERGKDIKDSMDIGAGRNSIKIISAGYIKDNNEILVPEKKRILDLLYRVQRMDLPRDPIFGITGIFVVDEDLSHLYLEEIEGKIIEFDGNFFKIPSLKDFDLNGYWHFSDIINHKKEENKKEKERKNELIER